MALITIQHVRERGWSPTASVGREDGKNAAINAQSVGRPPGGNVWRDLEGVGDSASALDVTDYCNAWHAGVSGAGYIPGLYVGRDVVLTGNNCTTICCSNTIGSRVARCLPCRSEVIKWAVPSVTCRQRRQHRSGQDRDRRRRRASAVACGRRVTDAERQVGLSMH